MDTNSSPPPTPPSEAHRAPAPPAAGKPRFWNTRGFKRSVSIGSVVTAIAVCVATYARATHYGQQVVEAHPVDARIEMANSPAYLDRRIITALLEEAYQYAQQDQSSYERTRNPLDASILREFAELYTGTQQTADGRLIARQTVGYNAWIKNITAVRRNVAKDKSIQAIQIYAEWRVPAAWVRVNEALYLIDAAGTRLPGDYKQSDRGGSKLMVITGADLPLVAGANGLQAGIPQPGEYWHSAPGGMGADLAAGMQLADTLRRQPFVSQIDAIDVSNLDGRRDPRSPWIVLDTIWAASNGAPRAVLWGRPMGAESFFDVKAEAKIKSLNEIYQRFNRIDAGRDYVDIHTEVVRLPKLALGS